MRLSFQGQLVSGRQPELSLSSVFCSFSAHAWRHEGRSAEKSNRATDSNLRLCSQSDGELVSSWSIQAQQLAGDWTCPCPDRSGSDFLAYILLHAGAPAPFQQPWPLAFVLRRKG